MSFKVEQRVRVVFIIHQNFRVTSFAISLSFLGHRFLNNVCATVLHK